MTTTLISPGFRPTDAEARDFVRRRPLTLREWSRRRLRIVGGPVAQGSEGGIPYFEDLFPPQAAVMAAVEDSRFREVVLMTGPQTFGKTLCAAIAPLLYAISHRRVSAMYVAARAELAVTQWRTKIKPAILADPQLAELIPENPDYAGTGARRDFVNGTSLHMAGAESVGALSGYTASCIICDDCHAYPDSIPNYGHPADYADSRSKSYPAQNVTLVKMGTASTVEAWLYRTLRASTCYCPFVPCLACGCHQLLEFERLVYDETDPDAAIADTWMRCANPECTHEIRFDELPTMLEEMAWVSMPPTADWIVAPPEGGVRVDPADETVKLFPDSARPTTRAGFWCNALYWPYGDTWGQMAAAYIGCCGDPDKLKTFTQNTLARPWAEPEDEGDLTPAVLAEHASRGHRTGIVPAAADVITLAVDVHSSGEKCLYIEVVAWRMADAENWLIDARTIGLHGPHKGERLSETERVARWGSAISEALEDIYELERTGWPHEGAGGAMRASLILVDGGHRKDRVGPFCYSRPDTGPVRGRKWCMTKGEAGERQIIERAGTGRLRVHDPKGSYPFLSIGVDTAKHRLRDMLGVPRGHAGYCHFPDDKDLAAYFRHLTSERAELVSTVGGIKRMRWLPRKKGIANHWLDCRVLNIAAALLLGVRFVGEAPAPGGMAVGLSKRFAAGRKGRFR